MKQHQVGSHFGDKKKIKKLTKAHSKSTTIVQQHPPPPRNFSRNSNSNNNSNNSVDGEDDPNWRLYASPTPKFSSGEYDDHDDEEATKGDLNHNQHHHVNMNLQRRMKNVFGRFVARDAVAANGFAKH